MKSSALLLLVAPLLISTLPGCKLLKRGRADGDGTSENGGTTKTTSADDPSPAAKPSAGCALESPVTSEVTIKRGCSVAVKQNVVVEGGGVLRIEAGVKLAFASDTYLQIRDAKLVVAGTEKEPVTFTSANATKAPGDWAGIFIDEGVMAGTELQWARIDYAGESAHGSHGAITMTGQRSGKRVALSNVTFQNNDQAAIASDGDKGLFARFEKNTFKANKISVSAPAAILGSIGAGNSFGDPLETWGEVHESASWQPFGVAVNVKDNLAIKADGAAPVLTLAPGTTLKFAGGTYLSVGENNGGGLIASKCTFSSVNASPHAGDWVGLFFYKRTTNVNLEGSTIEHAGQESHGGRAAITFYDSSAKEARGFKLTGLTVKSSEHAAVASTDNDCGEVGKQVVAQGVPACRKE